MSDLDSYRRRRDASAATSPAPEFQEVLREHDERVLSSLGISSEPLPWPETKIRISPEVVERARAVGKKLVDLKDAAVKALKADWRCGSCGDVSSGEVLARSTSLTGLPALSCPCGGRYAPVEP